MTTQTIQDWQDGDPRGSVMGGHVPVVSDHGPRHREVIGSTIPGPGEPVEDVTLAAGQHEVRPRPQ